MLRVVNPKDNSEPVVVFRLRLYRERVIGPARVPGYQQGAVPSPNKITPPAPDVASLMKPPIAFDLPSRRALHRVRVVDDPPADQSDIVKSLVEQHTIATFKKKHHR